MSDRTKQRVIELEQSSDEDELFSYLKTTHPIKPTSKVRRPIVSGNGKRNLTGKASKQDSGRLEIDINRLQNNSEKKDSVQHKTMLTVDIGPGYSDTDANKHGSGVKNLCMTTPEAGTADKLAEENNGHADVNKNNPEKISEHFRGLAENYQQDSFDGTNAKQEQSRQDFKMGESKEKTSKESDATRNDNKYYLINEKDWLSLCAKISDSEMQEHVEIADRETRQLGVSEVTGANSEKLETNSQVMNTSPVKSPLNTSPVKSPLNTSPVKSPILATSRGAAMFNIFKQYGSVSNDSPREVSFIQSPVKSKSRTYRKVDQQNSPTEPHMSSVSDNVTRQQGENVIIGRSKTEENNTTPKVEIVYIRLEDGQIKYDDMNSPLDTTESKCDSSPQAAVRNLDFCEDRQVDTVRNEEIEISQNNNLLVQSVLNSVCPNTEGALNLAISGGQGVHCRFVRINNKLMRVYESTEQNIADDVLATSQEVYKDEHIPFIEEGCDENDSFNFDDSQLVAYPVNAIDPDMVNSDSLTLLTPSKLDLLDIIDINLSPEKRYTTSPGYMPAHLSDGSSSESPIVLKVTRSGELVPCRGNEKSPVSNSSTPKRHIAKGEYGVVKDQGAHIRSLWKNFKPQNSGKCARKFRSHIAASEDPDCEITNNAEDKGESSEDDLTNYFKQKNLTGIPSESSKVATVLAQPLKENVSNAVASTSSCSISIQASFTDSEDEYNNVEMVRTKRKTTRPPIFQQCPYKQVNFKDFESEVDLESQLKEEKPKISEIKTKKSKIKILESKATCTSIPENSAKDKVKIDSRTKHYDEAIAATVNRVYEDENLMKDKSLTDSDETRVCDEMAPIKRPNKVQSHPDKQVSWKDKTDICVDHRKPKLVAEEKPDVQNKPKNLFMKRQSGKSVGLKNSTRSLIAYDSKEVKQTNQKVEVNKLRGKPNGKKSQKYDHEITYKSKIKTLESRATCTSSPEKNSAIRFKDKVKNDSRTKLYDEAIAATVNRVYKDENLMKDKSFTDSDETRVCDEMAPIKRPNKVQNHPDKQVSWKDKTDLCVDHRKQNIVAEDKPDVQNKQKDLSVMRQSGKSVGLKNSTRSLIANDSKEVKQKNQKVEVNKLKGKASQKYEQEITYHVTRGNINTERIEHSSINTKTDATYTTKLTDEETSRNSVKASKIDFLEKLFHVKLKEAAIDTSNTSKNRCESSMEELCDTNNLTECVNGGVSVGTTTEVKRPRGRPRKDATTVFKRIKAVSAENTRKTLKTESIENKICDKLKGDKPAVAEISDNRLRKHADNTDEASAVDANMKTVPQFDKIQKTELRGTDNTKKRGVSSSDKDPKLKKPRGRPRLSTNTTKSNDAEMKLKEISNAEDKSLHPDPLIVKRPRLKKNGCATRLNVNIASREIESEKSQKRKQPKTSNKKVKIKERKHDLHSSSNTDVDPHISDSVSQGEDISYLGKFQPLEQTVTKVTACKRKRINNEKVVRRKSQKIDSGINESDAKGKITTRNENIKKKGRKRKSLGLDCDELEVINDGNLSLPKEKNVEQDSSGFGNKMKHKKLDAPFSKQLRDGKKIKQTSEHKKSPGSLKSAKTPVSRARLKAISKRHANDSWKDMLEDEAFKFDFDERINEEHRPVNVRRMIRKILKSAKRNDNSKVVKVKHRERKDKHRERSDAGVRQRLMSESDDAWLSDSGPSASFPAFKFAGIDEIIEENQSENYIPLMKTVKESSQVEDSSRKETKGRNQNDDKSRLSESRLFKQTVPIGNDKSYMELHHSPVKDVCNKVQQEFKQASSQSFENPTDTTSDNPIDAVDNAKGSPEVKRNVNRLIALLDKVGDKKTVNS